MKPLSLSDRTMYIVEITFLLVLYITLFEMAVKGCISVQISRRL